MNVKNNIALLEQQPLMPDLKKKGKRFTKSLEYELIANLVLQQYQNKDKVNYDLLLAIPLSERIPGLTTEYGYQRMYRLLVTIIREFSMAIPLPKSRKLNDTRVSVCACDLMLSAYEDQLSLEDIILFFERAKEGKYGSVKKALTHQLINQMLEIYRQERHEAYMKKKEAKEAELKNLGPVVRTSPEPTSIKNLFDDAGMPYNAFKKIG
jgi:hypothetical protein